MKASRAEPDGWRGQIVARDHGFANRGEMADTLHDAVERAWRDFGLQVFDEDQARLGRTDLGDRAGNSDGKRFAVRYRGLNFRPARSDRVNEIGIGQHWGLLQHATGDVGVIGSEGEITTGGACSLEANARASAARTSVDGSSSKATSAPSAAACSSALRSE